MNIYVFVSLFCTLLQTYVLYRYYLIFFHKKRTPLLLECSSYLLFFVVNAVVYLKLNIPMVTLTANMIGRYLLTYNYEGQQKNRIALSLLYCFVAALIELIVVFLSTYTAIPIDQSNSYSLIYGPIFTTVFMYLFVFYSWPQRICRISNQTALGSLVVSANHPRGIFLYGSHDFELGRVGHKECRCLLFLGAFN